MYSPKQIVLRGIFIGECVVFFGFYLFGSRGLPQIRALRAENKQHIDDIMTLENDIILLQKEIDDWNTYPFYKEKIAREELQLINPGDTVYFVK